MSNVTRILKRARELLTARESWIRYSLRERGSKGEPRYCMLGAIVTARQEIIGGMADFNTNMKSLDREAAAKLALQITDGCSDSSRVVWQFNDQRATHEGVLRVFDEVLAKEEKDG